MSSIDEDCFDFQINIWTYLYINNDTIDLVPCIDSFISQTHKYKNLVIIDDGSSDETKSVLSRYKFKFKKLTSLKIIRNETILGEVSSKLIAIEYISKNALPNDIYNEITNTAYYSSQLSLKFIVLETMTNKAWVSYGCYNSTGLELPLTKEVGPLSEDGYYCWCSVFLLKEFSRTDFTDISGLELRWGVNKMFIYKCMDLCGLERTHFCKKTIFYKNLPYISSNYIDTIDHELVKRSYKILPEVLHIVIYVYHKPYNLPAIVNSLNTMIFDKEVVIHIINSAPDKWHDVLSLQHVGFADLKIILCNTTVEQGTYCRLLYINKLLKKDPSGYVLFLDDDLIVPKHFVSELYKERKPLNFCCTKGFVFDKHRSKSDISFYDNNNQRTVIKNHYDFGAGDGSLLDMNILYFDFFIRLDEQYIVAIDELWLSFVLINVLGVGIKKLNALLYEKASEDTINFTSNVEFVDKNNLLLKQIHELGFIKSNHINISAVKKILKDNKYWDKLVEKYVIEEYKPLQQIVFDESNIVLYFNYKYSSNDKINDVCYHTIKNYSIRMNTNMICINIDISRKEDIQYKINEIRKALVKYNKVLVIDGVFFINDNCPNLFNQVPVNRIGCVYKKGRSHLDIMVLSKSLIKDLVGHLQNINNLFYIGEAFNYDVNAEYLDRSISENNLNELKNQHILNFNNITNEHMDMVRTVKSFGGNDKITLMVMNCHRPAALVNTILPYYDINCSDLIDQIIIYHAKKETQFDYMSINRSIYVNNIFNEKDEERYVLFNRYTQPAKYAFNNCILIVDDDVIPNREILMATKASWEKNKMNTHGVRGRVCEGSPKYTYSFRDLTGERAPIILTSFLMTSLDLIKLCIKEEPRFYETAKNYIPVWNGEDIFLSILAMSVTKQKNFIINTKNKIVIFKRDKFAISGCWKHVEFRTELSNILCVAYNLDKDTFLL